MALSEGITTSRQSDDDLEIVFKSSGEEFSVFVPKHTMKTKSKSDIATILADPLSCSICCGQKSGFALCMARCIEGDGMCCDSGKDNCTQVGS